MTIYGSPLLELPRELRDHIWSFVFQDQDVDTFAPRDEVQCTLPENCEPCLHTLTPYIQRHRTCFSESLNQLLTCKQIYHEASNTFFSTLTLHISSTPKLSLLSLRSTPGICAKITKVTLYIHIEELNHFQWRHSLEALPGTFPVLQTLTLHNHMRPPTSYDHLTDAIYICGPLTTLPPTITQKLIFAYPDPNLVMFDTPWFGKIKCSDSLEEHEAVVRDLLCDEGFKREVGRDDLDGMTVRLLEIARGHEERWLEGLKQKRLREIISEFQGYEGQD